MHRSLSAILDFIERERWADGREYAVMLALIVVVCLGAITTLGQNANGTFSNVGLNGTLTSAS